MTTDEANVGDRFFRPPTNRTQYGRLTAVLYDVDASDIRPIRPGRAFPGPNPKRFASMGRASGNARRRGVRPDG
jgi:hypothetical protein